MSVELLRLLSPVQQVRDQLRELEGLPVLLSLLLDDQTKLLWSVAWVLVQLCQEPEARAEIRSWGGVQQLLWLLHRFAGLMNTNKDIDLFFFFLKREKAATSYSLYSL